MGGSQKSKRISWASDVNLCQVRLFLSEESPSQVGMGTQDHLQAKAFHSGGIELDDNSPPGFEGIQPANLWSVKLSRIPLIKWRCPPRFEVNIEWQVVAGEESKEMEAQSQWEMRVLEAIYPRPSAIPPNPSGVACMEDSITNDQNTPVVPVTPIEDDDANSNPIISQPHHMSHGNLSSDNSANISPHANGISSTILKPDIVAAAQVDRDFLVKILNDPKTIEQLVTSHSAYSSMQNRPSSSFQSMQAIGVKKVTPTSTHDMLSTSTQYVPNLRPPFDPINNAINGRDVTTANGPFCPPPIRTSSPSPSVGAPVTKDINYYKSLIQQHGGERRGVLPQFDHRNDQQMGANQEPVSFMKSKPKIMKPCIYFNSSKGCRNGANCAYQHDPSSQLRVGGFPEVQSAKRVKLDRGITGI